MWTNEVWIFDLVASQFLAPIELLSLSQVSKELNTICRQNRVWKRHKDRVIKYMPRIENFFKDKRRKYWDTWSFFVRVLMKNPIRKRITHELLMYDLDLIGNCAFSLINNEDYLLSYFVCYGGYVQAKFLWRSWNSVFQKLIDTDLIKETYHKIPIICAGTYVRFDINDLVVPYQCVVFDDMRHYDSWLKKLQRYIHDYWENCETNKWV